MKSRRKPGTFDHQAEPRKGPTPPELLAHLAKAARPMSLREIAAEMELKHHGRRELAKMILRLRRRGEVEEVSHGRFMVVADGVRRASGKHAPLRPSPPAEAAAPKAASPTKPLQTKGMPPTDPGLVHGRLVAHQDGYGFVVPDTPIPGVEGDLFIGLSLIHI